MFSLKNQKKCTDGQKIIGAFLFVLEFLRVELGGAYPLIFYSTDNHFCPKSPRPIRSQILISGCPFHISNSFFNLFTVLSETLVSLATFLYGYPFLKSFKVSLYSSAFWSLGFRYPSRPRPDFPVRAMFFSTYRLRPDCSLNTMFSLSSWAAVPKTAIIIVRYGFSLPSRS